MIALKKSVFVGLLCCAVLASAPTHAALVKMDLAISGDGLLTRDTATGLEWLDLTQTYGFSWNDIAGGTGGWLSQGFRYATSLEVGGLFTQAGITQTPPAWTNTGEALQVSGLLDLIGVTHNPTSGKKMSFGLMSTQSTPGFHYSSCLGVRGDGWTSAVVQCDQPAEADFAEDGGYILSHHLVREAAVVPIPGALFLFGSGLIGLAPLMRRRAQR